jgi:hypothetical protein
MPHRYKPAFQRPSVRRYDTQLTAATNNIMFPPDKQQPGLFRYKPSFMRPAPLRDNVFPEREVMFEANDALDVKQNGKKVQFVNKSILALSKMKQEMREVLARTSAFSSDALIAELQNEILAGNIAAITALVSNISKKAPRSQDMAAISNALGQLDIPRDPEATGLKLQYNKDELKNPDTLAQLTIYSMSKAVENGRKIAYPFQGTNRRIRFDGLSQAMRKGGRIFNTITGTVESGKVVEKKSKDIDSDIGSDIEDEDEDEDEYEDEEF